MRLQSKYFETPIRANGATPRPWSKPPASSYAAPDLPWPAAIDATWVPWPVQSRALESAV